MHPVMWLGTIATVYMLVAGYKGMPLWHLVIGALLVATLNLARAALAHVGHLEGQVISHGSALSEGAERLWHRMGARGTSALIALQLTIGARAGRCALRDRSCRSPAVRLKPPPTTVRAWFGIGIG